MSALEIGTNYSIGIAVSWIVSFYIAPYWGLQQSAEAATALTVIYTITSVIRAYIIRRTFNWIAQQ